MSDKVSEFDSDYLKEKRAKRRKRQKQIQYSVFGVLLFIIILILIYMFTPLNKISSVEISGNNNTSKNTINKAINVKDNSRMYTYSTTNAQNKLEESTLINSAEVKKHFPNKLTVKVSELSLIHI